MLQELLTGAPFALIRMREDENVMLFGAERRDLVSLDDITLATGDTAGQEQWDRLVLVPFAQIAERGFEVNTDDTPLTELIITSSQSISVAALLEALPTTPIEFIDRGGFETDDVQYSRMVREVIDQEIGRGEGANVVIGRNYRAQVRDWNVEKALAVFRNLLARERGAYWTFCIFTGDRFLIGASPERHVSVDAGTVRMNPISGTLRLRGLQTQQDKREALLEFLSDEKEIYELFMVVDEELKMMCHICHEGGMVLGPYLKPMSHLVHTEYLLAGRTNLDVRHVLRDSMFAATVTGSPVESACRIIHKYEGQGRGYYSAVAALFGRAAGGEQRMDAPILIRTADVDLDGNVKISAGATLVRDSDPDYETQETWAKASGMLSAFGLGEPAVAPSHEIDDFARLDEVLIALGARNQRLSQFWLSDQSQSAPREALAGKTAVIVDAEDDFVNMLAHVLTVLGMHATIERYETFDAAQCTADLVVLGPGPGDPRANDDAKIARLRRITDILLERQLPIFAVCLGHQVLCGQLGCELQFKDIVFQGTQSELPVFGQPEVVGFYNTFVARVPDAGLPTGYEVESDPATGDIHAVYGPTAVGVQFHAESILTQNGPHIIASIVERLLTGRCHGADSVGTTSP